MTIFCLGKIMIQEGIKMLSSKDFHLSRLENLYFISSFQVHVI